MAADRFPLAEVFTISRGSRTEASVLTVSVTEGGVTGRGEGKHKGRGREEA